MTPASSAIPELSGLSPSRAVTIDTDLGPGRMHLDVGGRPGAVLLLGHGAGGGVDTPDLAALRALAWPRGRGRSVAVLRYEQPWRVAGKKIAPNPARLDQGWGPAVAYAAQEFAGLPLLVGGRSAGARVAARWSAENPVAGVVALSFPLHPPGRPEKSRAAELCGVTAPTLVLQGQRDPFGTPSEVLEVIQEAGLPAGPRSGQRSASGITVVQVPDCPHELKPPARAVTTPTEVARLLIDQVGRFCTLLDD